MPSEDGVGSHDGRGLGQEFATKGLAETGQASPFVVGEADAPLAEFLPKNLVLFDEVVDHALLEAVDSAGEQGKEEEESGMGWRWHGPGDRTAGWREFL